MVVLPPAGVLDVLHLPTSIANLTIKNQPALTDATFSIAGTDNISTLVLENMNNIDQMTLINNLLGKNPRKLNRVRLIGIDVSDYDLGTFMTLKTLQGLDENGMAVDKAVITGKLTVTTAYQSEVDEVSAAFPELEITVNTVIPDPILRFVFTPLSGTVTSSIFTSNLPFTKVSETVYEVSAPPNTRLTGSYNANGFIPIAIDTVINESITVPYNLTEVPEHTIIVKNNEGDLMVGAIAVLNGNTYTTNASGEVKIFAYDGIKGEIYDESYGRTSVDISIDLIPQSYKVIVYPYVNIIMYAMESKLNSFVSGVYIDINGETYRTDSQGKIGLKLAKGTYSFTARYNNADVFKSSINVDVSGYTTSFKIDSSYFSFEDLKPAFDGSAQFLMVGGTSTTTTIQIYSSADANYSIDWGGGAFDQAKGVGSQSYTHNYSGPYGSYPVRILNGAGITNMLISDYYTAFWSVGNSNIKVQAINSASIIAIGRDVFGKFTASFQPSFSGCQKLEWLEDGIFDDVADLIIGVNSLFNQCYKLKFTYPYLWKCKNITTYSGMFSYTRVAEFPVNILGDTSKATNMSNLFYGSSVERLQSGILGNCSMVTSMNNMLQNCTSLTDVENGFLDNAESLVSAQYFASGCTNLLATSNLFSHCGALRDLRTAFVNCKMIDASVILRSINITNAEYLTALSMFESSAGTEHILESDFENINVTNRTQFSTQIMFRSLATLKTVVIPDYVFAMSSMFTYCNALEWIEFKSITPSPYIDSTTFGYTNECSIYVPDAAVDTYKAASVWSAYADRIKPVSERI
jgi:hypothetical protein